MRKRVTFRITFSRTFENYKWYKPLLVLAVGLIIYSILQVLIILIFSVFYGFDNVSLLITGGYESPNSDVESYFGYLVVAIFLLFIYLTSIIVKDRPFSSYSSSRGGWNWKLYFKCLSIPLVIYVIFCIIYAMINGCVGPNSFNFGGHPKVNNNIPLKLYIILYIFGGDFFLKWNLIWPILIVILANTFYNICMKSMPSDVNPFGALMVTYFVAGIISAVIFAYAVGPSNVAFEMSKVNWTSVILAIAIVGLEVGYVFVYREGWQVSNASVVANIGLACVLIFVGYFLYRENVSIRQILGIFVCMAGLVLINL